MVAPMFTSPRRRIDWPKQPVANIFLAVFLLIAFDVGSAMNPNPTQVSNEAGSIVCGLCFDSLGTEEVSITDCGHFFHNECILGHSQLREAAGKPLKCPSCRHQYPGYSFNGPIEIVGLLNIQRGKTLLESVEFRFQLEPDAAEIKHIAAQIHGNFRLRTHWPIADLKFRLRGENISNHQQSLYYKLKQAPASLYVCAQAGGRIYVYSYAYVLNLDDFQK